MWDDILLYAVVGFTAQIVDGSIGMAYKIAASSLLLTAGVSPATASACVHTAGTFTTAASGLAHWHLGNIDPRLVWRLMMPGMIGGAIGVFVLANVPGEAIRPWVSVYLLLIGVFILWKALKFGSRSREVSVRVAPVGFLGGLLDAIGGGGWGPIVTSALVGRGVAPRAAIGSVNAAEFFVTLVISSTFLATVGISLWPIIAGLVAGGIVAAPLAALVVRHLPERVLIIAVGSVVLVLSCLGLLKVLI